MIRLNRNDINEFIIERDDLSMLLRRWDNTFSKEHKILLDAISSVRSYEQENGMTLSDIRVLKSSNLGQLLFQKTKEEMVQEDSSEIAFSLLTSIVMNSDEALTLLDDVSTTLKEQEKNPSKEMIEQAILLRPRSFTNPEESPLCITGKSKIFTKIFKK